MQTGAITSRASTVEWEGRTKYSRPRWEQIIPLYHHVCAERIRNPPHERISNPPHERYTTCAEPRPRYSEPGRWTGGIDASESGIDNGVVVLSGATDTRIDAAQNLLTLGSFGQLVILKECVSRGRVLGLATFFCGL